MTASIVRRADALDALRGLAVLLMVLSGNLHFANHLPAWMYHAQVPPPDFTFHPDLPGITWVDLVFPFFLFAMGAAFPFGLTPKLEGGVPWWKVHASIVLRGLQLVAFAIFLQHTKPFVFSSDPQAADWIIGLVSFAVMFAVLVRLPSRTAPLFRYGVKAAGILAGTVILALLRFPDGTGFQLTRSDIIIIVLANVAVFGSILWIHTRSNPLLRLGVLGILMAFRLTQGIEGSWNQLLWTATPFPWMYKLYFLQYLFIVIPGTVVGDLIHTWLRTGHGDDERTSDVSGVRLWTLIIASIAVVVVTVAGLFMRSVPSTMFVVMVLSLGIVWSIRNAASHTCRFVWAIFSWGAFWLLLGFCFEAYEGGIKKDHPTISYYFVTTGLACYALVALTAVTDILRRPRLLGLLIDTGQNPMIAYVAGNVLILPVLSLTGLASILTLLTFDPWLGFVKGVIFTLLVAFSTVWCTRHRLFWRT